MVSKTHPAIASEGRVVFLSLLSLTVLTFLLHQPLPASALLLVFLASIVLFRDPARKIPSLPLGIVSPVDGRVKRIEKGRDPYLKRDATIITLRKSFVGVGGLRSPIEGKLGGQWHATGSQKMPDLATWVRTDEGDDIVWVVQGRGLDKPRVYSQPGERVGHGQRCGFQLWASDVKVYLPLNSRTTFKQGQRVLSGSSVIAHLIHKTVSPNLSVEAGFSES